MHAAADGSVPENFQAIIDHFPAGVSVLNGRLEMVACNQMFRQLLDFPDELFANGLPSLHTVILFNARRGEYGPGDPEVLASEACERARKMQPHVFERTRPNGNVLEIRGTPLPDGGFITSYTDITDRKRAEAEAIRAGIDRDVSRTGLTQILGGSSVATFVLDRDHRVAYWNRALENLTGVSADSVVGTREQWRPFYPRERPVMADLILSGGPTTEVDQHYSTKWQPSKLIEGAYEAEDFFPNFGEEGRWVFFTAAPLRDETGQVVGAIETLQDVTERRLAEAALKEKAEQENLRTSSYFQEVLINLPFGVLVLDTNLNTVFWNSKAETLFDLPKGFIHKQTPIRTIVRRIAENGCYGPGIVEEQVDSRCERLGQFQAHSVELRRPGGGTLLVRSAPVMIANKPTGLILLQEDISERKQDERLAREQDMEKSLAVLQHAVGNISQGISMVDADLNLVVCNPRLLELFDFPESFATPGTPFEAAMRYNAERGDYGPGDIEELVRTRVERARRREPHVFERARPDGRIIEVVGKPLPEGGFLTTYTDVTERKRSEMALREFNATLERKVADRTEALQNTLGDLGIAQTRLAQIIDGSPIAAFVIDRDHRVTHWNRACEKLTGVSAASVLGTSEQWRAFYSTERPMMADLIVAGESENEVARHYAKWRRSELIDGALEAENFFSGFGANGCWLYFTAAPLRNPTGDVIGAIETLIDITEQRRAEASLQERAEALQIALSELGVVIQNLEQTQDELVRSEKLAGLGSMVAGIAHELNTPIGNSLMVATHLVATSKKMAESLKIGLKRSALDEFLANTDSAGDLLVRNLNKAAELVSSFKQVAVDQTSSQRRSFNLAEMVAEVVTTIGPAIRKTPHIVEQNIPDDIVMESFPGPLGQVMTNLINNGIIHGFDGRDAGRIRIEAERGEGSEQVVLRVRDNGNGIAANILPRIFDPFFTTKLGQGGSGLGLNIVHNMVFSILGGRISAESVVGQGTCFTMMLPMTAPEQDAAGRSSVAVDRRTLDAIAMRENGDSA
jgi:PAS domain S-box-containing protein